MRVSSGHYPSCVKVITFGTDICHDLSKSLKKEWLEANRFGGFASSTIPLINTKRHHGLLVAPLRPPLGSYVLLSGLDEILHVDDVSYNISSRIYEDTVFPEGYRHLDQFSLIPFPTWIFLIEDLILERNIYFVHDEQTVLIRYQILSGDENLVRLELKPITACRPFGDLTNRPQGLNTGLGLEPGHIRYSGMHFYHNAPVVDQSGTWYRGVQYPEDKKLNLDYQEDLYAPCRLIYAFGFRRENFLCASLHDVEHLRFRSLMRIEPS